MNKTLIVFAAILATIALVYSACTKLDTANTPFCKDVFPSGYQYNQPTYETDAKLKEQDDSAERVYNTYIKNGTDTACQTATKKTLCSALILSCGGKYAVSRTVCPAVCKAAEDACPANTFDSTFSSYCSDSAPSVNPCYDGKSSSATALKGSVVLMVVAFIASMMF
jgi:hypothetical protein